MIIHEHYIGITRDIAKRIKNPFDTEAIRIAAEEMADYIPEGSVLIPAPPSDGVNIATFLLAREITKLKKNVKVEEVVVRKYPVQSSYKRRLRGLKPLSIKQQYDSMMVVKPLPENTVKIIIDNVITSGNTLEAIKKHLIESCNIDYVIYAYAGRGQKKNPFDRLVVTIAGSRKFNDLGKINQVLKTLPEDTIILHGGAKGVDEYAGKVAEDMGFEVLVFPPEWDKYGKSAGMIRNAEMIKRSDCLIAFWDGESKGTKGIINIAKKNNIDYEVIND